MTPISRAFSTIVQIPTLVKSGICSLSQRVHSLASRVFVSVRDFFTSLFYRNHPSQGSQPQDHHSDSRLLVATTAPVKSSNASLVDTAEAARIHHTAAVNDYDDFATPLEGGRLLDPKEYEVDDAQDIYVDAQENPQPPQDLQEAHQPQGRAETARSPTLPAAAREPQSEVSLTMTENENRLFDAWIEKLSKTCDDGVGSFFARFLTEGESALKELAPPQGIDPFKFLYAIKVKGAKKGEIQTIVKFILSWSEGRVGRAALYWGQGEIHEKLKFKLINSSDIFKALGSVINPKQRAADVSRIFKGKLFEALDVNLKKALIGYLCKGNTQDERFEFVYNTFKNNTHVFLQQALTQSVLHDPNFNLEAEFYTTITSFQDFGALNEGIIGELAARLDELYYHLAPSFFGLNEGFLNAFLIDLSSKTSVFFIDDQYYQSKIGQLFSNHSENFRLCDYREETHREFCRALYNLEFRECGNLVLPGYFEEAPTSSWFW